MRNYIKRIFQCFPPWKPLVHFLFLHTAIQTFWPLRAVQSDSSIKCFLIVSSLLTFLLVKHGQTCQWTFSLVKQVEKKGTNRNAGAKWEGKFNCFIIKMPPTYRNGHTASSATESYHFMRIVIILKFSVLNLIMCLL